MGTPLRKFAPRLTKRERILESNRWDRAAAALGGLGIAPKLQQAVPEKRVQAARTPEVEAVLEAGVIRDVAKAIALCPNVLMAWRQNGGAAPAADGVFRIWYYRWIKRPVDMTLVDYICVLKSGKLAVLECKRRDWKWSGTPREVQQKACINAIRANGGRGGFCTSAEQAIAILK